MKKNFAIFILISLSISCSWIDRKLAESNGEYYQTLNCSSELAVKCTKQIIKEENYNGVIINQDGNHKEIWFKINENQRVRISFTDDYFWDTIISFYCTNKSSKELANDFYNKLQDKISRSKTDKS